MKLWLYLILISQIACALVLFVEQRGQLQDNYRHFPPFISSACLRVPTDKQEEDEEEVGGYFKNLGHWQVKSRRRCSLLLHRDGGERCRGRGQERLTRLMDVFQPSWMGGTQKWVFSWGRYGSEGVNGGGDVQHLVGGPTSWPVHAVLVGISPSQDCRGADGWKNLFLLLKTNCVLCDLITSDSLFI